MAGMKTSLSLVSFGVVMACLALGPGPATAAAQHRAQGSRNVGHQTAAHPNFGHRSFGNHNFHRRPGGARLIVVAPFFPFSYYSSPLAYSSPMDYAPPPASYPPPMYSGPPAYAPPVAYAPPPPQQPPLQQDVDPMQREVVFPPGRYVLRGDGITTPYTWVWIPNPPTAPPGGAAPGSGARDSERAVYSWTDGNGVTTWTDRLSRVPPEYRATVQREF
jgi:hypothetical protein